MAFNPYYGYIPNQYGKSSYYMQQPNVTPQYQPQATEYMNQMQNAYQKPLGLQGKTVDNIEVVKATDIPLDGSVSYFPLVDGSAIITKQLQQDGTSRTIIYRPSEEEKPEEIKKEEYVTIDKFNEAMKDIDSKQFKELKEEMKTLKRQIRDLSDDIRDKKGD